MAHRPIDPGRNRYTIRLNAPPFQWERPKPAEVHWLGEDEDWTKAPELGLLARVFNQDTYNLMRQQDGLTTTRKQGLTFSAYQEMKIRHFYSLYSDHLALQDREV